VRPGLQGAAPPAPSLRVELDDSLLVDVNDDLVTGEQLVNGMHGPGRASTMPDVAGLEEGLAGDNDRGKALGLLANVDDKCRGCSPGRKEC
jgi:hypothetical protein